MQYLLCLCLRIHSIYLQQLLFGLLLRVILLIIMVPIGCLGFIGDWNYLVGLKTSKVDYIIAARYWFPFDKNVTSGEADLYLKYNVYDINTYRALNISLYYDPYSIRYRMIRMQLAFALKDNNVVTNDYNILKAMAPNLPIIKEMNTNIIK